MAEKAKNESDQLDELTLLIGKIAEQEDSRTQIINLPRMKQMEFVHDALEILVKGQDVAISTKINEPFKSMGSVSVEGRSVSFYKPEWFNRVAQYADNVDIYPLTNGKIRMTFTFHGLTNVM